MLWRLACGVVTALLLLGCGGDSHPPPIDLDRPIDGAAGAGAAPDEGGDGKNPISNDLRQGGFINLPQVSDILYDEPRGLLYVTTTQGGLASVKLETGKISTQKIGDGPLLGLDLSPSGAELAICENSVDLENMQYWIHIVDLEARTLREVYFPQRYDLQEGTHDAGFADDQTLYLDSSFTASGYVPLIRLNLGDDSFEALNDVMSDSMFARSLDNSTLVLVSPKDAIGPFYVVDTSSLDITKGSARVDLHDLAVNADGSMLAFPTAGKVKLLAKDDSGVYSIESAIEEADRTALAAVFNPVSSSIYVTWSKKLDNSPPFVERYNLDSLESEGTVQTSIKLADTRLGGFQPTRMRISSDGTLLFITVETGINVYALEP